MYLFAMSWLPEDQDDLRTLAAGHPALARRVAAAGPGDHDLAAGVRRAAGRQRRGATAAGDALFRRGDRLFDRVPRGQRRASTRGSSESSTTSRRTHATCVLRRPGGRRAAAAPRGRRRSRWPSAPAGPLGHRPARRHRRSARTAPDRGHRPPAPRWRGRTRSGRSRRGSTCSPRRTCAASEVEADVLDPALQTIDRVRTDLVSTVSHELRTPLTSVKGYLELLQDQLRDAARRRPAGRDDGGRSGATSTGSTSSSRNLLALVAGGGDRARGRAGRPARASPPRSPPTSGSRRPVGTSRSARSSRPSPVIVLGDRSQLDPRGAATWSPTP